MLIANGNRESTVPPSLESTSSPSNVSPSSSETPSRCLPSITPSDLASLFAAHSAVFKQNLLKHEFGGFFPMTDPSNLLSLSQLLSSPLPPPPPPQPPTRTLPPTERKRPYPCSFQFCVLCQKDVHSSKLPCHIRQCHVAKPMFQCPACDFTSTYSKNNVKSHMVSLHGLAGDPISFMDQYAGQVEEFMKICFPNVRGRGRPMHGRNSPLSPSTLARRNSQSRRRSRMDEAVAEKNAMQSTPQPPPFFGWNPLLFPASLTSLQKASFVAINNNLQEAKGVKVDRNGESEESTATPSQASFNTHSSITYPSLSPSPSERSQQREVECKYIEYPSIVPILSHSQQSNTVFNGTNVNHLIEKCDMSAFEGLFTKGPLLTEHQTNKIANLIKEESFKLYEVLYALHKIDPSVLSSQLISELSAIAPSEVDVKRIRSYQADNNNLSEEEEFLVQLSKVERLEEKLFVLGYMKQYKNIIEELIEKVSTLSTCAYNLRSSTDLRQVIQLVLLLVNVLNGDCSAQLIQCFRVTQLDRMSTVTIRGHPMLTLIASLINTSFPDIKESIHRLILIIEPLSKVQLSSLFSQMHTLHESTSRVERELRASSSSSDFVSMSQPSLIYLQEQLASTMDQLHSLLDFLCESRNNPMETFKPEESFERLLNFLQSLQYQLIDSPPVKEEIVNVVQT